MSEPTTNRVDEALRAVAEIRDRALVDLTELTVRHQQWLAGLAAQWERTALDTIPGISNVVQAAMASVVATVPGAPSTAFTTADFERAIALLDDLLDPDPCWFDHHGGCQAHGYLSLGDGERCPVAEGKELVARFRPAERDAGEAPHSGTPGRALLPGEVHAPGCLPDFYGPGTHTCEPLLTFADSAAGNRWIMGQLGCLDADGNIRANPFSEVEIARLAFSHSNDGEYRATLERALIAMGWTLERIVGVRGT